MIRPKSKGETIGSGNSLCDHVRRVFGSFPITLDERHMGTLEAMHIASGNDTYKAIFDAIERYGEIELDAES